MAVKGLKLIICFCMALILAPFNIFAEPTYGTPFIGVNINVINYDMEKIPYQGQISLETEQTRWACYASSSNGCIAWRSVDTSDVELNEITGRITYNATSTADAYLYEYDFVLDKSYVGSVTFATGTDLGATTSRVFYINGSHLKLTSTSIIRTFTVDSYDLEYAPQQTINMMQNFDFPTESLPFIYQFKSQEWEGIKEYDYYSYPIINLPSNFTFRGKWGTNSDNWAQTMILGVDKNIYNQTTFESFFTINNGTIDSVEEIYRNDYINLFSIFKVKWHQVNTGNTTFTSKSEFKIIPIYLNYNYNKYISTDFALLYGLSNKLLDDIHLIANGTTATTSAAQSSDSANSQLQQDSNTLFQQEDSFKSNMQSAMQNVPQFNVNTFGTKFMNSAQWVRTQYERMTNNTPFQHLITFSLLVGLSMILIGKVRK